MPRLAAQTVLVRLAIVDVILFVAASVFNDHSSTSFDGILWWVAIAGFVLLFAAANVVMLRLLWSRTRGRTSRTR